MRKLALERRVEGISYYKSEPISIQTTGLLLLNKQVYAEALPVLRKAPLIIGQEMLQVFRYFGLTIAHYVSLPFT